MAKFCATIIGIALFCLFTLSLAGAPAENDEATTTLSLPSEPVNTETDSNSAVVSAMPLTKVTFRPVNRRFHVRSKHPCRHHFKVSPTMRENEVPYGNDMIVSTGENSDFEDPVVHGGDQRIPGRWVRLHHHHHDEDSDSDDDDEDEDRVKKIVFKRYDYDRVDREKKLKVLKKLKKHFRLHQNEEEENKKNGGFMKRVSKFLDHYF